MFLTIFSTYKRNRRIQLRAYPISFMFQRMVGAMLSLLLPVLLYYFVFDKNLSNDFNSQTNGMNYLFYACLGYCAYSITIATLMNVGRAFILEIREETIDSFLVSPASRIGYFLGVYLEQIGRSLIEFSVIFVFSLFLGMPFEFASIPVMVFSIFLLSVVSFSMSILLSSVMIFTRDTFITQNTLFILLTVLSGITFPVKYLPNSIQIIINLIPLTHAINIFRSIIYLKEVPIQSVYIVAIESTIYLLTGYYWFKNIEKKLIEEVLS